MRLFQCPICEGEGRHFESYGTEEGLGYYNPCGACNRSGKVSIRWLLSYWFWNSVPVSLMEWYAELVFRRSHKDP